MVDGRSFIIFQVKRDVAGRGSDWRRGDLDNAVLELKRAGTDESDWRRAAEAEAGPPQGSPGW